MKYYYCQYEAQQAHLHLWKTDIHCNMFIKSILIVIEDNVHKILLQLVLLKIIYS